MTLSTKRDDPITSRWFAGFKPNPEAKLSLFCFPYAGGGAPIFRNWANNLPSAVEVFPVQLPGRGSRLKESPCTDLSTLISLIAEGLAPYLTRPFVLFGHSLGAMIGFELIRKWQLEHGVQPIHQFVSGHRAPHISELPTITYNLPENEFIEELRRLKGTPGEVLDHPELMRLMMPMLRADFQIYETYDYVPGAPLNCSITAFGGLQDERVPREYLEGWRDQTSADFNMWMLSGDHFFVHTAESRLLQILSLELNRILEGL
jgi:surfactin synthase thioesterase subunit